jgi:hypothetical protein
MPDKARKDKQAPSFSSRAPFSCMIVLLRHDYSKYPRAVQAFSSPFPSAVVAILRIAENL